MNLKTILQKILAPFQTTTYFHHHLKITYRPFPPIFRTEPIPKSIQELVDQGGVVYLPEGVHLITDPITITKNHTSLVGAYLQFLGAKNVIYIPSSKKNISVVGVHVEGDKDSTAIKSESNFP